jgi:hypothetical protein
VLFASIGIALLAILTMAARLGYWSGRHAPDDQMERSRAAIWQTALLTLAGLIVGFTFSMAASRYDARKQLLLAEANSIGTTYLRTQLLADPAGGELRALIRQYVDARLAFVTSGADRRRTTDILRSSSSLEKQIWSRVVTAARTLPPSPIAGLIVQATNDMFVAGAAHVAAVESPLPSTVFVVLILATAAAMASVGFACGLEKRRSRHGMVMLPVLLGIVVLLVFDLSHPRLGYLRVNDPILEQLKQSL